MSLPSELTSFVGRERELADLDSCFKESRLITLTGAGGSGKTRLGTRAGSCSASRFPQGVWLVELASETDGTMVPQRIASSLGVQEPHITPVLEAIIGRLRDATALLLLDSCEHLVEHTAEVAQSLLRECPRLSILCTSQEPLGLDGEVIRRVPGLSLPTIGSEVSLDDTTASEAVRLFIDRAALVNATFELTAENAGSIAQICRQLDGIPLAIELAAARVRLLNPDEIVKRLADRFSLLVGSRRHALPRHQTLRAAVAWTYEQLTSEERSLFCRLAVFSAGFTLEAAERICPGKGFDEVTLLTVLERLVDRAMIVNDPTAPDRHRLLESLRQYGSERMAESPVELRRIRQLHCQYYLGLAISAGKPLFGPDQAAWMGRLTQDVDNIRSALAWALLYDPLLASQGIACLFQYWVDRGDLSEAAKWCAEGLSASPAPSQEHESILLNTCRLAWIHMNLSLTESIAREVEALALVSGDQAHLASALSLQSAVAVYLGGSARARHLQHRALLIRREIGDMYGEASSFNNLGLIAAEQGSQIQASRLLARAKELAYLVGNPRLIGTTLESAARIQLALGDLGAAEDALCAAISCLMPVNPNLVASCIEDFSDLRSQQGRLRDALLLAGAANSLRIRPGAQRPANWRLAYEKQVEATAARMSSTDARRLLAEGAAMSLTEVVSLAVQNTVPVKALLTKRELQVSVLVAAGLSNKDIATNLHMSVRTADAHVEHIRNKLGVRSRVQVAAWVASCGRDL